MKKTAIYILVLFGCNSCATLFNKPTTNIKVYSDKPTELVVNKKKYIIENTCKIKVPRQNDTLILIATSDSLKKVIKLKQQNSFNYYANVLTYGLGFIWDSKSPKRYTYQKNIYIDYYSTKKRPERFLPSEKRQMNLVFSIPYINNFYLQPQSESVKTNTGFWGLSASFEYYYKSNKFINISASAATDFFVPIPAAVDLEGEYESMSSIYFGLTNNYQFNSFTIGYGLNFSKNTWNYNYSTFGDSPPPSREPVTKSSQSIGLILNSYYQLGEHFNIGLIYRPTFFNVYPKPETKYEHLISVDLAWKIKLKK